MSIRSAMPALSSTVLAACLVLLGSLSQVARASPAAVSCVILLHGLARTEHSLRELENAVRDAGHVAVNLGYRSRQAPVEMLAEDVIGRSLQECRSADAQQVHFITHSLGGILVRHYLAHYPCDKLGRVVMLSPPNQGSEAADELQDLPLYQWFNGPAGQQLVTGPDGLPARLGPVDFPLGIITGNRHAFFDGWLADLFPGEHDGKVSVERAKVEGMSDFLVVPAAHPFIMDDDEVIAQSLYFLRYGRFHRSAGDAP
jgi:pimeloyl-ACP methyl ester carboxylesterase